MKLSDHQAHFTADLARLIRVVPMMHTRWRLRLSYAERSMEEQARLHAENPSGAAPAGKSQHNKRLAADLLLDIKDDNGVWQWQESTEAYREIGTQWELMSLWNRWGGRYHDGNHFERLTTPRPEKDSLIA